MKKITIGSFMNVCWCENYTFKIVDTDGTVKIIDLIYDNSQSPEEHIRNYNLLTNNYSEYTITNINVMDHEKLFITVYGKDHK